MPWDFNADRKHSMWRPTYLLGMRTTACYCVLKRTTAYYCVVLDLSDVARREGRFRSEGGKKYNYNGASTAAQDAS